MKLLGTLRLPALFIALAAVIHLLGAVLSGFDAEGRTELVLMGLAVLGALGLWRGWRLWAWAVLMVLIVAMGAAFARVGASSVPDAMVYLLLILDLFAAVTLFAALWRGRVVSV